MNTLEGLKLVRARLERPEWWTKHEAARDETGRSVPPTSRQAAAGVLLEQWLRFHQCVFSLKLIAALKNKSALLTTLHAGKTAPNALTPKSLNFSTSASL